jgi:hypothetical protein
VTLEEAFECSWFDQRISGIIQASLEIGLTVGRVILVESRTGFFIRAGDRRRYDELTARGTGVYLKGSLLGGYACGYTAFPRSQGSPILASCHIQIETCLQSDG